MYCVSTASIPPIIGYQCSCGYHSKSIEEPHETQVLPAVLWADDDQAKIDPPKDITHEEIEELFQIISDIVYVYYTNNGDMEYSGHSVEKILKDHGLLQKHIYRK